MPKRISRGSPAIPSAAEQEAFVRAVETRPQTLKSLEAILGVDWSKLTFQQKVQAVQAYIETGGTAAAAAQTAKAWRDLLRLGDEERSAQDLSDRLHRAELRADQLDEDNASLRAENLRLRNSKDTTRS